MYFKANILYLSLDCLTKEAQDYDSDEAREAVQEIMKDIVDEVVKTKKIDYVNNYKESYLKDVNNDLMEISEQDMNAKKNASDEIRKVSLVVVKQESDVHLVPHNHLMGNTLENVKKNLEELLSFLEFPEEGKVEAVEMFLKSGRVIV